METYIVRQPIMNGQQKVEAYELLYQQDSSALYNQRESTAANAVVEFFAAEGADGILDGKDAYVTFTPNLLMRSIPRLFDESRLVIQLEDNVLIHPQAKDIIARYKEKGYRIALLDFEFNKRSLDILPLVDVMKVDFADPARKDIPNRIGLARQYGMKVVAYRVDSPEAMDAATAAGADSFQGHSVAEMVRKKVRKVEHLQSNFFRLMAAITREEPEFDEIAQLIAMDVTLTFSLFRIVNSAYFGLKNRVKDIKQALAILGMGQLKQWIYLMSFSTSDDASDEIVKLSFQRATFCQELAQFAPGFPGSRAEGYLLGMFSTLDVLLEVDMAEALAELPLTDELREGLVTRDGSYGRLLGLCIAYEKGEWSEVRRLAGELETPLPVIGQKYFESVEFVNDTWDELMQTFNS